MAKVRDVLARIGDDPLVAVLKERGYRVFPEGDEGDFDMVAAVEALDYTVLGIEDTSKAAEYLREYDFLVIENADRGDITEGYELYRNRRTDEFRQWLRDFFWESLGRIA